MSFKVGLRNVGVVHFFRVRVSEAHGRRMLLVSVSRLAVNFGRYKFAFVHQLQKVLSSTFDFYEVRRSIFGSTACFVM